MRLSLDTFAGTLLACGVGGVCGVGGSVECVGVWSVEGGWQGEAYIHLWNEQTVTVAYTEYCFSSGQN